MSHPEVFSTHVKELCKALESEAPTADTPNSPGAVEDLKACAGFAKKFPEKLPLNTKEGRRLTESFINYALYGSPPKAAKHAITIIMNSDDKKKLRAKQILAKSIKDFEYGCDHFLTKLAAISQLVLLAPQECEDDADAIMEIAVNRVLLKSHATSPEAEAAWMETPDDDMVARTWALKILVNRLRSFPEEEERPITDVATPIYAMLNRLVKEGGEASKKKNTPLGHKNLQRLLASQFLLKLSCTRSLDTLLTPADFNQLILVVHDECYQVRKGFATTLMKYLGQNRLPNRFYVLLFMYAYEPESRLLEGVTTWIRSRRAAFAARKEVQLLFETSFARLLSLLAYHPDFDTDNETLKIMSRYIIFYLKCVATPDNLSLIFYVAQRVKGVQDGISSTPQAAKNLYILSDLSQALIRLWEEQNGWSMQSWPGKLSLPGLIFKKLESHERAQEIADKVWVDEDLIEELEPIVRLSFRNKKRKAHDGAEKTRKKVKSEKGVKKEKVKVERSVKTPKPKKRKMAGSDDEDDVEGAAVPSSEPRRKSDRRSGVNKSYVEVSSDDEEKDAEGGAQEEEEASEDSDNADSEAEKDVEMAEPEPEKDVEMAEPEPEKVTDMAGADSDLTEEEGEQATAHEEEEPEPEAEPEQEVEPDSEPEHEPEPTRKRTQRTKPVAKSKPNKQPVTSSPLSKRKATALPATNGSSPLKSAKGKAKAKERVASSPATNGSTRRSARTRG